MTAQTNAQKIAAIQKAAQLLQEITDLNIVVAEQTETKLNVIEKGETQIITNTALKKIEAAAELLDLSWFVDTVEYEGEVYPSVYIFTVLLDESEEA
jgi:inosine/xanthosine triphosphate pyrophosphatase family protein